MSALEAGRSETEPWAGTNVARYQVQAMEMAEGFFGSQVLFCLNGLGVFERLADGPLDATELAAAVGARPEALGRVLNAAVATGLLTMRDGRFANAAFAEAALVPGRPGYLGNWMRLMARYAGLWTRLEGSVRTGHPGQPPDLHLGADPGYTRDFLLAMQDYAQHRGAEVLRRIEFPPGARVLDLGGGPGTYAILFARAWPDLRIDVFDLPDVVRVAEENAREAGVADRVSAVAGDYRAAEVGSDYDVVFLSDTLHQETPDEAVALLEKAYRALKPGGRIIVQGMFLNEDRVSPRWPVMLSVLMLLLYGEGRNYTVRETTDMLETVGFRGCRHRRISLADVNSLILAVRPVRPDTGPAPK